jgi:hypothetical protein
MTRDEYSMPQILLLTGSASPADLDRCRGLVDFLRRRARLAGEDVAETGDSPEVFSDRGAVADALHRRAERGRLSHAPEILYTPSREALRSVLEAGPDSGFPEAVQKKQAAAFRTSQGALLRFPLEQGDGALEVFITDWSPCPAACAVAIHRIIRSRRAPGSPAAMCATR